MSGHCPKCGTWWLHGPMRRYHDGHGWLARMMNRGAECAKLRIPHDALWCSHCGYIVGSYILRPQQEGE